MLHDLKQALRLLVHQPGFSAAALLTLALGIGANTAIFSVVYGVLLKPLPYPDSSRLVQLSEVVPGGAAALPGPGWISNLSIDAWQREAQTVGPIVTFGGGTATVGLDTPQRLPRGEVGPQFFDVLGLRPVAGRFFNRGDADVGAAPVVVIAESLWRERFGASTDAIGQTLIVDERPYEVIGVAPAGVSLPDAGTRLWTPSAMQPVPAPGSGDVRVQALHAFARLRDGVTTMQAAAEGTARARTMPRPLPAEMLFGKGGPVELHVRTLVEQATMQVRPALLVILAAVGLLLAIACGNVANLFLSRGVSRERDFAVRMAIGAGRGRLIREAFTECLAIAGLGGLLGIALASVMVRALPAMAPEDFPRIESVALDWMTLGFGIVVSLVSGVVAGIVPALRVATPGLLPSLREGAGASSGRRVTRLRRSLLAAETALAVVLLVGAILLGRSFLNLVRTDPGYDASGVLMARIYLPGASQGKADTVNFVAPLLDRVRALPGVTSAAVSNMTPLGRSTFVSAFSVPRPGTEAVVARAISYVVTPGYVETLGLRVRSGRLFGERDLAAATQAILVNEEFVRVFLEGRDAIGLRFPAILTADDDDRQGEIVGVLGNVLKDGVDQRPQPEVYVLAAHGASVRREINLLVRTAGRPEDQAEPVRRAVAALRADAAVDGIEPLEARVAASVAQPRFAAAVLMSFAGLALLLAAVGLYGVLSYAVARRRREIGVRSALGATRAGLVALIVRDGVTTTLVGIGIGLVAAAGLTRLLQAMLVGIEPLDPSSFALAATALLVIALVACALPARRAAAIDPTIALRCE